MNKKMFECLSQKVKNVQKKGGQPLSVQKSLDARLAAYSQGMIAPSASSKLSLRTLYDMVREYKPMIAVETGTYAGVTATVILEAMKENGYGHLYSIDQPAVQPIPNAVDVPLPVGEKSGWLIPDYLRENVTLFEGESQEILQQLNFPINLFFHDSLHTFRNMWWEYAWAWKHLDVRGWLISDDIGANSAFSLFCMRVMRKPIRVESIGAIQK